MEPQTPDDIQRQIDDLEIADDEQILIMGPARDVIQIGFADFMNSHYREQGYQVIGFPATDEPEEPRDDAE